MCSQLGPSQSVSPHRKGKMSHRLISCVWPADGRESIFMQSFHRPDPKNDSHYADSHFISCWNNDNKSSGVSRLSIITRRTAGEESSFGKGLGVRRRRWQWGMSLLHKHGQQTEHASWRGAFNCTNVASLWICFCFPLLVPGFNDSKRREDRGERRVMKTELPLWAG